MLYPYNQSLLRTVAHERQAELIHEGEIEHLDHLAHPDRAPDLISRLHLWLHARLSRRPTPLLRPREA